MFGDDVLDGGVLGGGVLGDGPASGGADLDQIG